MTGRERCDEILRIIDQVLGDAGGSEATPEGARPRPLPAARCEGHERYER